ncbi:MAG: PAS domain-containing protein [Acidimicrobiaceae bacterium]|nr:PAS domain-containing protein [Acidimicrobiaceae bacterium]
MTSLIVGVLLVVGGAMLGIALDRALLQRWIRNRDPQRRHRAPGGGAHRRRQSARRVIEDAERRMESAEAGQVSAETAASRVEASLDALEAGLVLCDRDGRVVAHNTAATQFLQARHGEALVTRVIKELLEQARSGEQATTRGELHAEPRRSYEGRAGPVERGGEMLGAIALVHDITEHDRIESVRRDFVANVSHELKTPIGALSLLADSLAADTDPEVAARLAGRMQIEIQRVANTIDDLLTLAMLEDESGRADERVDIGAVVAAASDRISETAELRDVKVVVSMPADLAPIRGSRLHLESAVFNLLDNAIKFSDPGERVDVQVETDRDTLTLSVTDEGIGIPAAEQSRIFERFYRVDRARSRSTGGTGLGLSIVRHVALNHGGEVSVTSREGLGAQFNLELPLDNGD